MSLPIISNDELRAMTASIMKDADENLVSKLVHEIHANVLESAKVGSYYTVWSAVKPYQYKHVILAANRLRVLFPGSTIDQNRGRAITVAWY